MSKRKLQVSVARAYNDRPARGAYRVLVDRLWPRGIKKEDLPLDAWAKDLAPSATLRRWFGHDPEKWDEFRKRYFRELALHEAELLDLLKAAGSKPIVLIYGARDETHNDAVALKEFLERRRG